MVFNDRTLISMKTTILDYDAFNYGYRCHRPIQSQHFMGGAVRLADAPTRPTWGSISLMVSGVSNC